MKKRSLQDPIEDLCFRGRKMAFVSGPRQCGKTTLARMMLDARGGGAYHNWDDVELRRRWVREPKTLLPGTAAGTPLAVFDEIHKARSWKRTLKGIYDTRPGPVDILVTGSARLDVYRKGGDSLLGRYFHFRLHPFSLGEMQGHRLPDPDEALGELFSRGRRFPGSLRADYESLMAFGPFPEPLFAQSERRARLWRRHRVERVIREDLRDLTRIPELSRIEMLAALLPARVGSLLSIASLRDDLEVSFDTVKRWMSQLQGLYYVFEIKPYRRKIARSLRKAGKWYMGDSSEVPDPAARFENLVAIHLLKACHAWTDVGAGVFELYYLRNKQGQEIDFLIVRDGSPWLPVEAKWGEVRPSPHWSLFLEMLGVRRGLQIVHVPGRWETRKEAGKEVLVASAEEALWYLV